MLFLNPWLLAGLAAVSIPVIIHLVRQQAAKPVDWGAMRFLFDTIAVRRASAGAALACTKLGAQPSLPYAREIEAAARGLGGNKPFGLVA